MSFMSQDESLYLTNSDVSGFEIKEISRAKEVDGRIKTFSVFEVFVIHVSGVKFPAGHYETRSKARLKEDIAKYLHSGLGSDFRMPADVNDSANSGLSEII